MTSIYLAIALFALAAILGLTILFKWLTNKSASRGVVYSHGVVAAAGLVLLLAYAVNHPDHFPMVTICLLALSAIVGFYMFFRDLSHKMSPMGVAIAHALVAAAGLVSLIVFAVS